MSLIYVFVFVQSARVSLVLMQRWAAHQENQPSDQRIGTFCPNPDFWEEERACRFDQRPMANAFISLACGMKFPQKLQQVGYGPLVWEVETAVGCNAWNMARPWQGLRACHPPLPSTFCRFSDWPF